MSLLRFGSTGFFPRQGWFQESKLLPLLALLQTLCQFGFLIPLQEGLIAALCRVVVPQEELQFLIPPWRTFNTLLVEAGGKTANSVLQCAGS